MTKSQSPAKKIRSLKRLLTFRMKFRIQHLNNKQVKSNLSICGQASVSIEPCNLQQEPIKEPQPFTLNDFVSLAEASRKEDTQQRKKEKSKRKNRKRKRKRE